MKHKYGFYIFMRLRRLSLNNFIYIYIYFFSFSEPPCYHEEHDSEGSLLIHFKARERKFQKATRKFYIYYMESFRGKDDGI